jgi:hypothetical protein
VQFAPGTPLTVAVLADFPLTFTVDFQTCAIDDSVSLAVEIEKDVKSS